MEKGSLQTEPEDEEENEDEFAARREPPHQGMEEGFPKSKNPQVMCLRVQGN
jgi:hypothetical protein